MTQTITKCNEIPAGKTYPVEHLRTAESIEQLCAYVDAGHPIATVSGRPARLLRRVDKYGWLYDWLNSYKNTVPSWPAAVVSNMSLLNAIKLAPLAYRNGRPLHVGDKILMAISDAHETDWIDLTVGADLERLRHDIVYFNEKVKGLFWRFADEVAK